MPPGSSSGRPNAISPTGTATGSTSCRRNTSPERARQGFRRAPRGGPSGGDLSGGFDGYGAFNTPPATTTGIFPRTGSSRLGRSAREGPSFRGNRSLERPVGHPRRAEARTANIIYRREGRVFQRQIAGGPDADRHPGCTPARGHRPPSIDNRISKISIRPGTSGGRATASVGSYGAETLLPLPLLLSRVEKGETTTITRRGRRGTIWKECKFLWNKNTVPLRS
jgi:hypothetical protein